MSIFTKEQLEMLEDTEYSFTDSSIVKLRASIGVNNNWLITGWAEEDYLFFGYVCINGEKDFAEWGSISKTELEDLSKTHQLEITTPNISFIDAKKLYII